MFKLVRHADLSLRFYGPERAILTRRDGARIGVTGQPASLLFQLTGSTDLSLLAALGRSDSPLDGPLQTVAALFRALLAKLDRTPPRGFGMLLKEVDGLAEHSLTHRVPLFGLFELTYFCNLRCDHCYVLHKVSEPHPSEVDEETARRVLDSIAELGCLDISLSGGETTLHRGYRRLLAHAKDLHLYTLLKTNGMTMTRRNAELYAEDPAHETHLSLYGSTAEVHDEMTAVPGSFEKTLQGLRELDRVGLPCKVYVTIWKRNVHQLAEIRSLLEDLGHIASFDDIIHGRLNGDRSPVNLRISREQRADLVEQGYLRPFNPAPCTAGAMKLKVSAEGGVTTCELLPEAFGNVFQESLLDIWQSEEYAGYGRRIIGISKQQPSGRLPILSTPRTSCPGLNVLNTGKLEGQTFL